MNIDEVVTRVQTLNPKKDDVLILRFEPTASRALIEDVKKVLRSLWPKGVPMNLLLLRDGFELSQLSSEKMAELGWVRKNVNAGSID